MNTHQGGPWRASAYPDNFWWGTGNSSTQCEGAAPCSDWALWEQAGNAPASGGGNGFAERYGEDFRLLKAIGLDHFRLSIEWARIEPVQGQRDRGEVERYRSILQAGRDAGLSIWVTAHHFTLPQWFAGFDDAKARRTHWQSHIAFLAQTFGDFVFGWKPINEPHAFAMCGWLLGIHPPGIKSLDAARNMLVATHLANHEAWQILRQTGRPVATIHDLSPAIALSDDPRDQRAADAVNALSYDVWIRMLRDGVLRLPDVRGLEPIPPIEDETFIDAFDVIGFSYYHADGICVGAKDSATPGLQMTPYPPDGEVGPLGYVPWSDGLSLVLDRLHAELPGKPLLISEYGIGTTNDQQRADYIDDGIAIVCDARNRGIDVRGFFHWTGVDNYEWTSGYDVNFGLFDRNRVARSSAATMARHTSGVVA